MAATAEAKGAEARGFAEEGFAVAALPDFSGVACGAGASHAARSPDPAMSATNDKSFIARFIARSLVARQEPAQRWEGLVFAALLACGGDGTPPAVSSSPGSISSVSALSAVPSDHSSPMIVSSAPPAPSSAPTRKRYVVAAMGDSLTDPKSQGGKYLDRLGEL